jgi:hypothetical protein
VPDNVWAFTSLPAGPSRALAWNGKNWTVMGQFNSGGHLLAVRMPLPPNEFTVRALARVAHTTVTFGGGDSHAAFEPWVNPAAVILRYGV